MIAKSANLEAVHTYSIIYHTYYLAFGVFITEGFIIKVCYPIHKLVVQSELFIGRVTRSCIPDKMTFSGIITCRSSLFLIINKDFNSVER